MLRKVIASSFVLGLLSLLPSFAQAQFQQGNWEITLGGSGTSDKSIRGGSFAVNGSLGYFLTKEIEVAVRQGVTYGHVKNGPEDYTGSTAGAVDYHFDLGKWQPFIGGNVGALYGKGRTGTASAGPEGGVKFFVNSTTFIYGSVAYEISLNNSDNSAFVYNLGIGFKF